MRDLAAEKKQLQLDNEDARREEMARKEQEEETAQRERETQERQREKERAQNEIYENQFVIDTNTKAIDELYAQFDTAANAKERRALEE